MRNSRLGSRQEDFQLFFCISFPQPGASLCSAREIATRVKEAIYWVNVASFPPAKDWDSCFFCKEALRGLYTLFWDQPTRSLYRELWQRAETFGNSPLQHQKDTEPAALPVIVEFIVHIRRGFWSMLRTKKFLIVSRIWKTKNISYLIS